MVTTEIATEKDAQALLREKLLPAWGSERRILDRLDRWWRWNHRKIRLSHPTHEHIMLRDMGVTPWLGLVVTTLAQTLYMEGVDIPGSDDGSKREFWMPWSRSRMARRQTALHRTAIAYGTAYTAVRAVEQSGGGIVSHIDCYSPRESLAMYDDPARDAYPQTFVRIRDIGPQRQAFELWDAYNIWLWTCASGDYRLVSCTPHMALSPDGDPVCPIVRYTNQIDLEGRAPGEVEPFIPLASRLDKDNYDRLLAQHYNSSKIRTATGLDMGDLSDAERAQKKIDMGQDTLLTGGPEVKFGTLDETQLDSLIAAKQADVEELAAVSQTPTTSFGKLVNVGDAGIEESRAGFYAKRNERRKSFGVSHLDTLRLCAAVDGRFDQATNFDLTALWEDTDTRTLSQAADAFGKMSEQLGIPSELLWDMIPGVTKTLADSWRLYKKEHPDADSLAASMYRDQLHASQDVDDGSDQ